MSSLSWGEDIQLGVTVITPSRLQESLEDTPASLSVITTEKIEEEQATSLSEVVRDVQGVEVRESGTIGEGVLLHIRGASPEHTLVLLDGVKVNSPFRGFFDVGDVLTENVGQIEILRGAQSALYGSEAMGGVINIRTHRATRRQEITFTSEAGTFSTFRESLSVQGKGERHDYSLSVSRTDSGGQFERDDFGETAVSGQAGYDLTPDISLRFISRYQTSEKDLGIDIIEFTDPVSIMFDRNRHFQRDLMVNSLEYRQQVTPRWEASLKGAVVGSEVTLDNPPDGGPGPTQTIFENTDENRITADVQNNLHLFTGDVLTIGFEYEKEGVESTIVIDSPLLPPGFGPITGSIDNERDNASSYLQNIFRWEERFALQTGVRVDQNSDFGTVTNPKVSTFYRLTSTGTRLKASWGKGFRAPTIQELAFPLFGNPHLEPEKSSHYEVGFDQVLFEKFLRIEAAYFHTDFDNLIQKSPAGAANIGKARSRGVEAGVTLNPDGSWQFSANYTYFDTRDELTKKELPFHTRNRVNANALWKPVLGLALNCDLNYVSGQFILVDFRRPDGSLIHDRIPGFIRLDAAATFDVMRSFGVVKDIETFLKVTNLLDLDYEEVPGFPAPGIALLAGLKTSF